MLNTKIPLAFYAYNRPVHTALALDALAACRRLEDFEFYFFSDGARNTKSEASVAQVRKILSGNADRFSAHIIERPTNLGLAKSIVNGVSQLCESYGRVVVLEDDLVVAPDFLHFMASALERYEDDPEVMQVGAYTIAPPKDRGADAFLLPVTTTWGWGTWARAWKKFSWTPEGWPATQGDSEWLFRFEINGAGNYVSMLEDRIAGRNDSWGILWWYAVSRAGGEVVYPMHSLVWNGGFDGSGVHCGTGSTLGQREIPAPAPMLPDVISFPRQLRHQLADLASLENILRSQTAIPSCVNFKMRSLLNRMFEGIRHALG